MTVALCSISLLASGLTANRISAGLRYTLTAMSGACSICPIVATVIACVMVTPAPAADIPGADQALTYHVVDQDVGGVIAGIAAQLGVRVDVSNGVQGEVHGRLPDGTVRATLDRLASLYRFDWYFDGQTLFATSMAQAQTKVLPLGAVPADDLLQTLAAFGVSDQRWPVRISRAGDMAYVSGPPRLVGMAENVLSALAQRTAAATADVRVFRGATAGS